MKKNFFFLSHKNTKSRLLKIKSNTLVLHCHHDCLNLLFILHILIKIYDKYNFIHKIHILLYKKKKIYDMICLCSNT